MTHWIELIIPIIALLAAFSSVYATIQANKISSSTRRFQEIIFLNDEEIKISRKIINKLAYYNLWCNSASEIGDININFHSIDQSSYDTRDEVFEKVPNEVKVLCIELQSRGKEWKVEVEKWEHDFIFKVGNLYAFKDEELEAKIKEFKIFRAKLLQS